MSKKVNYRNLIIGFIVLMVFVVSLSVGYLSHKTDNLETRVDTVETIINGSIE